MTGNCTSCNECNCNSNHDDIKTKEDEGSDVCLRCQYFIKFYYNGEGFCLLDHEVREDYDSCPRFELGNIVEMKKETVLSLFNNK